MLPEQNPKSIGDSVRDAGAGNVQPGPECPPGDRVTAAGEFRLCSDETRGPDETCPGPRRYASRHWLRRGRVRSLSKSSKNRRVQIVQSLKRAAVLAAG